MQRGAATLLSPTVAHCPLSSAQSDRGEYRTEDGLVKGHAYSVTGTHKVRNPQGGLARGVRAPNSPLTMPPLGVTGLHQGAAAAAAEPMGPSGVEWGLERQVGWIWGGWLVWLPPAHPLHLSLSSCPRWDALPTEWRDALLVKKEDGEFW